MSSSNSRSEEERPSRPSLFQSWQPNIVRNSTLVAFVFALISVYRSHQSLHQQFLELANGIAADHQLPALILPSNDNKKKTTIAYAISITKCNGRSASLDGAAVLRHSIQRFDKVSQKYDSAFHAFIHPNATSCADDLTRIGYNVHIRPTPLNTSEIRGNLKKYVEKASCCGSAEFLKLYTYTLTQYPVAVHLDMDFAVLKPMDDLYDAMLEGPSSPARLVAMWIRNVTDLPEQIDAYFTRDYNMLSYAGYRKPHETPMQGGFLVARPNTTVFEEYLDIIRQGKYEAGAGWGGPKLRFGGTYGSAQIQGLVAYYYGHVHPGTAVELNRCIHNTMVDKPYDNKEKCLSPREDGTCEDCRETNITDVVSTHFTLCQKPWWCPTHDNTSLCHETHKAWFRLRWELEMQRARQDAAYNISAIRPRKQSEGQPWVVNGNWSFCGPDGYIPMNMPSSR